MTCETRTRGVCVSASFGSRVSACRPPMAWRALTYLGVGRHDGTERTSAVQLMSIWTQI